jgi:hypothetical protein
MASAEPLMLGDEELEHVFAADDGKLVAVIDRADFRHFGDTKAGHAAPLIAAEWRAGEPASSTQHKSIASGLTVRMKALVE